MKRFASLLLIVLLCGWTHGSATFTPAWQPMMLGDGGNAINIHVFPSGSITSNVDTYNGFLYKPSGVCKIGARTLPTPCWQPMFSTASIADSSLWIGLLSTLNEGVVDIVECQGNTNVFYAIWNNHIWVSTNRGVAWAKTPDPAGWVGWAANAGPLQTIWIGCDPADTNGNLVYVNSRASGLFKSTNGTAGTSASWAHNGTVASAGGTGCNGGPCGGSVVFDPTSSVVGGVTQHFWVSSNGTGIYETTNGGGNLALTTLTPTLTTVMAADKFGQLWSSPGYLGSSGAISRYDGTWHTVTIGGSGYSIVGILFDPNTGASVGNNQVIGMLGTGQVTATLNNGTSWSAGSSLNATVSNAPQAVWLGTAVQASGLNVNGAAIDATGKMWIPGGISVWTAPDPISGCPGSCVVAGTTTWTANSIGIEQFVVNQILSPPGSSPLTVVWDRGVIFNPNPDAFATVQYPQNSGTLEDSYSIDYALSAVSGTAGLIVAQVIDVPGSSSDGGATWTAWPNNPPGQFAGGMIAVGSATNWCTVPGNSGGAEQTIYCTANAAATAWVQATIAGSHIFVPTNDRAATIGYSSLVAEKGTAGTFYAVDTAGLFYKSTNGNTGSPSFTKIGTTTPFDGVSIAKQKLLAVPGKPGELFYTGNPSPAGHLWKTVNSGTNWAIVESGASTMVDITGFGFGAAKPGGSGYPTIYASAENPDGTDVFVWSSPDGGTTFAKLNVPANQQSWVLGSVDYPTWVAGDMNVYGRVYYAFTGSGDAFVDTADACPWVNFSNTKMNAALAGTVSLNAVHSGLVPVSGVQFSVDGSNIGAVQTGQTTYSVSWNASGVAPGAHTLKVQATGNGCTTTGNSFSIPITTSANDNTPMWLNAVA